MGGDQIGVFNSDGVEVWGGVECTVNRIGDVWHEQLTRNGHDERDDDLELFAKLGLRAIRYPVLWERTAPHGLESADWSWPDRRLCRLGALGLRPIVGLLHHGSGPAGTDLTQANFPEGVSRFAGAVAERYPWLIDYTPVNEPLTTARFSGLYGHWYPHGRTQQSFIRALLNQCQATVLAMQAIREVNSDARLIQTEDLGKTHSTPLLSAQAELENHRRWLSIDLLTGRVDRHHALWSYLLSSGATERELAWFEEHPCPPDILGFNYYLTSERFLDERLDRYPPCSHGGNGQQQYADVEAIHVCPLEEIGVERLLEEAWQRYQLPLALTEVHLGFHRELQLRWLLDAWHIAHSLRDRGVDMRAITAWSMLGAFDWTNLCTRKEGVYESGVFDVRSGVPRPTILAEALRGLSQGEELSHPALPEKGWWQTDARLIYRGPESVSLEQQRKPAESASSSAKPLLIVGAAENVGSAFVQACRQRRMAYVELNLDGDALEEAGIEATLAAKEPWAVVNALGYSDIDAAERDQMRCRRMNVDLPAKLARACNETGARLLTLSSDLVFNGDRRRPYVESDKTAPVCAYGRAKVEAEELLLRMAPETLIIRTGHFFGPTQKAGYLVQVLRLLAQGQPARMPDDWIVSPTYTPDLAHACLDLLVDGESNVWHLANQGETTWADLLRDTAGRLGLDPHLVQGCRGQELKFTAPRPPYTGLGSERGMLLPALADGVRRYCDALQKQADWADKQPASEAA